MTNPYDRLDSTASFDLSSSDVTSDVEMPAKHRSGVFGAGGDDISPHLAWTGFPDGTKSFVVSMYDPSAPTPSGFWHWMVADIPVTSTSLDSGSGSPESALPPGAIAVRNDSGSGRYIGSAPPSGTHRYYIAVHALDVDTLGLDGSATPALTSFLMLGHILGRALIIPTSSASVTEGEVQ